LIVVGPVARSPFSPFSPSSSFSPSDAAIFFFDLLSRQHFLSLLSHPLLNHRSDISLDISNGTGATLGWIGRLLKDSGQDWTSTGSHRIALVSLAPYNPVPDPLLWIDLLISFSPDLSLFLLLCPFISSPCMDLFTNRSMNQPKPACSN